MMIYDNVVYMMMIYHIMGILNIKYVIWWKLYTWYMTMITLNIFKNDEQSNNDYNNDDIDNEKKWYSFDDNNNDKLTI